MNNKKIDKKQLTVIIIALVLLLGGTVFGVYTYSENQKQLAKEQEEAKHKEEIVILLGELKDKDLETCKTTLGEKTLGDNVKEMVEEFLVNKEKEEEEALAKAEEEEKKHLEEEEKKQEEETQANSGNSNNGGSIGGTTNPKPGTGGGNNGGTTNPKPEPPKPSVDYAGRARQITDELMGTFVYANINNTWGNSQMVPTLSVGLKQKGDSIFSGYLNDSKTAGQVKSEMTNLPFEVLHPDHKRLYVKFGDVRCTTARVSADLGVQKASDALHFKLYNGEYSYVNVNVVYDSSSHQYVGKIVKAHVLSEDRG